MGILDLNDIGYKEATINVLKEYIQKFYGNYGPIISKQPYYEIEGYIVRSIDDLIFTINCKEEDLMNAYIWIGYVYEGLAVVVSNNRPFFSGFAFTEKNGNGLDVNFEKLLNFLSHCNDKIYSKYYNFRYNKYYEPVGCE